MKAIAWMTAVAALAALPAPASASTSDPELIVYRFTGVRDDTGAVNTGTATVFNCTNFSGVTENIRLVMRDGDGILMANVVVPVAHLSSTTVSTHATNAYLIEVALSTGSISGGTTAIAATSINVICTAMAIDASSLFPHGVALRGVRFNPIPGAQE